MSGSGRPGSRHAAIPCPGHTALSSDARRLHAASSIHRSLPGRIRRKDTWSVYVQQNSLAWADKSLSVNKVGNDAKTFTATIENRGSQSESWSLSGMPEWLSANVEGGILTPLSNASVTFTVAGSLPIGTCETAVYLTGSQNISAPLNITVSSEGNAPD